MNYSILDTKHALLQGVKDALVKREAELAELQGQHQKLKEALQDLETKHEDTVAVLASANGRARVGMG